MRNRRVGVASRLSSIPPISVSEWSTIMFFRLLAGLGFVLVAACGTVTKSIEDSAALHLDQVSTRVAEVATREGIPVDRSETVATARSDGGVVVLVPAPHEDGRLVAWLELPPTNPCSARLTPGYYVIEPRLTDTEAFLSLREINGSGGLEGLRSDLERDEFDDAQHPALIAVALAGEYFSSWGWHKCSDGIGCCRWVLTLDASTPGCGST